MPLLAPVCLRKDTQQATLHLARYSLMRRVWNSPHLQAGVVSFAPSLSHFESFPLPSSSSFSQCLVGLSPTRRCFDVVWWNFPHVGSGDNVEANRYAAHVAFHY